MRHSRFSCLSTLAGGIAFGLILALPAVAAPPTKAPAPEAPRRSVFVIPTNSKEGRDPFFPTSNRPYEIAQASQPHVGDISSLVLKGVSGPPDRRLAIINNQTFGVGDSSDIVTAQGRIHVEIRDDAVVIESAGQNHELKYAANQ